MKLFPFLAAALLGCIQPALADQAIAERVVHANGYVLTVQLSDVKSDAQCKFGKLAARILSAREGYPAQRINLGCWVVNRDGSVEYSGYDEANGKDVYMKMDAAVFTQLPGFKSWGDYMGPFLLSQSQQ